MSSRIRITLLTIEHFGIDSEDPTTNLARFIEWAQGVLKQVPSEYRESAQIDIDSVGGYDGDHYVKIEIFYWRPETDEEKRAREIARNSWKEHEIAHLQSRIEALRAGTNFWMKEDAS